jgi:hypothetical protein
VRDVEDTASDRHASGGRCGASTFRQSGSPAIRVA